LCLAGCAQKPFNGTRAGYPVLATRSWLESPITLNVVTELGTLLAGIGAVWVILMVGPRYRLWYGPLWSRKHEDGSWEVLIYLSSRGRRDITRQAFDEGKPVELDIGVKIQELSDFVWSTRKSMRVVDARAEGTRLLIGPGLISRRQDLGFMLRTEAKPTRLTCQASLIDVRVRRQLLTPLGRIIFALVIGILVGCLTGALIIGILMSAGVKVQFWASVLLGFVAGAAILVWAYLRYPPSDFSARPQPRSSR
jgi:hypothetical protein